VALACVVAEARPSVVRLGSRAPHHEESVACPRMCWSSLTTRTTRSPAMRATCDLH